MTQISLPSIRSIFPEYVNSSSHNESNDHRRETTVSIHSLGWSVYMAHDKKLPSPVQPIQPLRLPSSDHHRSHPSSLPSTDYYSKRTSPVAYSAPLPSTRQQQQQQHHHHHHHHPQQIPLSTSPNSSEEHIYYPTHNSMYPQGSTSPQLGGMMKDMHLQHPEDDDSGGSDSEGVSVDDYERKHVCPHCSKRFNRPSSLRIHVNTHTGATPFKCPWPDCGRNFNVNSNMRRHYRNHFSNAMSKGARPAMGQTSKPSRRSKSPSSSSSSLNSSGSSTPANFVFVTSPPGLSRQRS